jgi:hypothetical protein
LDAGLFLTYPNSTKRTFELLAEFYNRGSSAYFARARLDVFKENESFTAWSEEKVLYPGDRESFKLYWFPSLSGNFSARIRIYYAGEILERFLNFSATKPNATKDPFLVYKDEVRFVLDSNKTLDDVIISFDGYPSTWMFEQHRLDVKKPKKVRIPFSGVWKELDVRMYIFTQDGKNFKEMEFRLERISSLREAWNWLIDNMLCLFG